MHAGRGPATQQAGSAGPSVLATKPDDRLLSEDEIPLFDKVSRKRLLPEVMVMFGVHRGRSAIKLMLLRQRGS